MNTTTNNNLNITAADIALAECKSEFKTLNECAKRYTEANTPHYLAKTIYPHQGAGGYRQVRCREYI